MTKKTTAGSLREPDAKSTTGSLREPVAKSIAGSSSEPESLGIAGSSSEPEASGSSSEPEASGIAHDLSSAQPVITRETTLQAQRRALAALAHLDPVDVLNRIAAGARLKSLSHEYGVEVRDLWMWVKATPERVEQYSIARDARAVLLVDEAHERTSALADAAPENHNAVMSRVRTIMWDAARTSKQYADKQITESHNTLDISITMQDAEVAARLSSLMGALRGADVVDGEIVEQDQ